MPIRAGSQAAEQHWGTFLLGPAAVCSCRRPPHTSPRACSESRRLSPRRRQPQQLFQSLPTHSPGLAFGSEAGSQSLCNLHGGRSQPQRHEKPSGPAATRGQVHTTADCWESKSPRGSPAVTPALRGPSEPRAQLQATRFSATLPGCSQTHKLQPDQATAIISEHHFYPGWGSNPFACTRLVIHSSCAAAQGTALVGHQETPGLQGSAPLLPALAQGRAVVPQPMPWGGTVHPQTQQHWERAPTSTWKLQKVQLVPHEPV